MKEVHPPETWSLPSSGPVSRLHIRGQTLLFCDERGGRRVDLATQVEAGSDRNCASKDDPDEAPDDDVVSVSSPDMEHEANDRVDIEGFSYWLEGRGHAWANEKTTAVVGSGSRVELIDEAADKVAVLDTRGADQVAIGAGWAAWVGSEGNEVHVASVSATLAKVHERDHKEYWTEETRKKACE